jgi:hypothetical protein
MIIICPKEGNERTAGGLVELALVSDVLREAEQPSHSLQ